MSVYEVTAITGNVYVVTATDDDSAIAAAFARMSEYEAGAGVLALKELGKL